MARFWVDPTRGGALVALCDRCAAEEKTARAVREQGWRKVSRSQVPEEEGAWYCQTCGELLEDVLPVRVLQRP